MRGSPDLWGWECKKVEDEKVASGFRVSLCDPHLQLLRALLFIYLFGTGSSGVQAGLELLTLLPQPPQSTLLSQQSNFFSVRISYGYS